jgi:zinc D-Ala-D-Ala carboxypeptidase
MRKALSTTFDLSLYTASETARKKGYMEQYTPDDNIIARLVLTHEKVVKKILALPELKEGELFCSSGYRCRRTNIAVGGSETSQHVKGEAIDLEYYEGGKENNMKLYNAIINNKIEFDQIIREFGSINNPAWIHVSYKSIGNRNQKLIIR